MKAHPLYQLIVFGVLLFLFGCSTSDETAQAQTEEQKNPSTITKPETRDSTPDAPGYENGHYRIVFLGDSITAGYGIDENFAFPSLIQDRIDSLNLPFRVVNAGVSGDTSTGGLNRIEWLLRNPVDILVLELGGNDGLRGIDLALTRANLSGIVERIREANPGCQILIAGMMVPPNLGHDYTAEFRAIFPSVAEEFDTALIPFILEGVGGIRELNLPDGIHPTAEGHKIVAETVWKALEPEINKVISGSK